MKHLLITTIAAVLLVGCWKPNIWQAAETGRIKDVNRHLDEGMGVNAKDPYGRTTIHYAAQRGHKEIIEMLIAKVQTSMRWISTVGPLYIMQLEVLTRKSSSF